MRAGWRTAIASRAAKTAGALAVVALTGVLTFRGNSTISGQSGEIANATNRFSPAEEYELMLDTRGAVASVLIRSNDFPAANATILNAAQAGEGPHRSGEKGL